MFRKYSTIDYPPRTIELQETTEHPASSYGQPVLVDRDGNAWDRWMVIPIEPDQLSVDSVKRALRDAIASEKDLPQEFHVGRVSALRFALDLLGGAE